MPGQPQPPASPPPSKRYRIGWSAVRRATLARDGHRCRKCGAGDDLQAHHKHERSLGGPDTLENLITLCGSCHDEWTVLEPPSAVMTFDAWLTIPPSRYLIVAWMTKWPEGKSAAAFKLEIEATLSVLREIYDAPGTG